MSRAWSASSRSIQCRHSRRQRPRRGCLVATATTDGERTVRLQIGLAYVFAALLFFAACQGCAGGVLLRSIGLIFG